MLLLRSRDRLSFHIYRMITARHLSKLMRSQSSLKRLKMQEWNGARKMNGWPIFGMNGHRRALFLTAGAVTLIVWKLHLMKPGKKLTNLWFRKMLWETRWTGIRVLLIITIPFWQRNRRRQVTAEKIRVLLSGTALPMVFPRVLTEWKRLWLVRLKSPLRRRKIPQRKAVLLLEKRRLRR